jgi:hypothetical protein
LTLSEIAALVATDRDLWTLTADALAPRLQKVGFHNEPRNA